MNTGMDCARELLTEQVLDATTLEEVLAAQQALRDWIKAHPEEKEWMRDGFEQLAQMQEIAEAQQVELRQQAEQVA